MKKLHMLPVAALGGFVLTLSTVISAIAAPPNPDSGPTVGGTTVTVGGPTFTEVSTGSSHAVALGSDGHVYAWGRNSDGQLGDGSGTISSVPVKVLPPFGVTDPTFTFTTVTAGRRHNLSLGSDGTAYAWGKNEFGQLGIGVATTTPLISVPVPIALPAGVGPDFSFTQLSGGDNHSVAIGSDGAAYAWGLGANGRLGNGGTANSSVPVQVSLPAGAGPDFTFTQISAGNDHTLAIGSDGATYAWGKNEFGQLGEGSAVDSTVPVEVSLPSGVAPDFTFTKVSAAARHSLAMGSDGRYYAWGLGENGRLGNGSLSDSLVPLLVALPAGVGPDFTFVRFHAGGSHNLAIGSDGITYAWGRGANGRLGTGTTANALVPTPVLVPAGADENFHFSRVSSGGEHSLAIGPDGQVYSWGSGTDGRLGNGSTNMVITPALSAHFVPISVTFDGLEGTGLTTSPGTATVNTPAHEAGPVDVAVTATLFGGTTATELMATMNYVNGFTYRNLSLSFEEDPLPFTG